MQMKPLTKIAGLSMVEEKDKQWWETEEELSRRSKESGVRGAVTQSELLSEGMLIQV